MSHQHHQENEQQQQSPTAASAHSSPYGKEDKTHLTETPYGGLLGVAPHGCAAFSNGNDDYFSGEMSNAPSNRPGYELELGYKWQCVEFVRRFLAMSRGVWIKSVPIAEQIWKEDCVIDIRTGERQPLRRLRNGGDEAPRAGDLLVWRRAHDVPFGHVAAITEVGPDYIRICEQNLEFTSWEGKNYSRQLRMKRHKRQRRGSIGAAGAVIPTPAKGGPTANTTVTPGTTASHFAQQHANQPGAVAPSTSGEFHHTQVPVDREGAEEVLAPNKTLSVAAANSGFEVYDEDPLLGWMRPECPMLDVRTDDIMDIFRYILTPGSMERISVFDPEVNAKLDAEAKKAAEEAAAAAADAATNGDEVTPAKQVYESKGTNKDALQNGDGDASAAGNTLPAVDTSLSWLNPTAEPTDFFLRRSLIDPKEFETKGKDAHAPIDAVPDGYYKFDYDLWMRVRTATVDLHGRCVRIAHDILSLPEEERDLVLKERFDFPPELAPLMIQSLKDTAPLGGRFDFGYDDQGNLKVLEYNCDSSAALLECADTQEKWSKHVGIDKIGDSTGSFLSQRLYTFWLALLNSPTRCPPQRHVHFLIDDDDEERYTALTVIKAAKKAGFQCKLCVKLKDFRFAFDQTTGERIVVDLDGHEVRFVWKTWSWDTILKDYREKQELNASPQEPASVASTTDSDLLPPPTTGHGRSMSMGAESDVGSTASVRAARPRLSDIMLNSRVRVLEPLWKVIVGSKSLLPYVWEANRGHPNLLPAAFTATDEVTEYDYISKPVMGRAGQNITMHDGRKTKCDKCCDGTLPPECNLQECKNHQIHPGSAPGTPQFADGALSFAGSENSFSGGRFAGDLMIYQQKIKLKRYDGKFYPIICAWTVEGDFGGIVIREDTSKITKLDSRVIPARVVRK